MTPLRVPSDYSLPGLVISMQPDFWAPRDSWM